MAGFQLMSSDVVESCRARLPISSLTLAIGDMIELDVGAANWTVADNATIHWQHKAICLESATTASTEVLAVLVQPGQYWEAESASSSAAADNGDRMVLTDQNTVNNSGTDGAAKESVFIQLGTLGAATDKRIWGIIVPGTGINPAAA